MPELVVGAKMLVWRPAMEVSNAFVQLRRRAWTLLTLRRAPLPLRPRWIGLPLLLNALASGAACAADSCLDALFTCETNRAGKYAQICATEVKVGEVWKDIYYRFGAEGVEPELVYPASPVPGKRLFFFSHTVVGADYRVSVRFVSGGYTYRIYSNSGQGTAGVRVSDGRGNVVSNARCIERPHMFPSYLQRALACDEETPYGAAACADKPLHLSK